VEHESDILWRVEQMLKPCFSSLGVPIRDGINNEGEWLHCRWPVFTYAEAMEKFGTDKPDIRTDAEREFGGLAFAWVVRFPMFKPVKEAVDRLDTKTEWTFMHNPFSAPIRKHTEKLLKGDDIGSILACQYDLVCNCLEIGSGSIRSHQAELLRSTFKVMGYSDDEVVESVGHMPEAFELGAPPHGGIALGIDRLVMLCCREQSMKEVVAFPTSTSGRTSVMDAPCPIRKEQKKELGL
jgi:aspartyl-tRNA synthetase